MDEDIRRGLKDFDKVWGRVTGTPEPGRDEAAALRDFIGDESRDAAFYAELARMSRSASRTLWCVSADERRHARALQLEYYLLTGESFIPSASCPLTESLPSALRQAYRAELQGAEAYGRAAEETESPALRELYLSHAEDEKCHAETVKGLISRFI